MAKAASDMIVHCVIADDEPIARIGMQRLVQQVPWLRLEGMARNATEVKQLLAQQQVQLLFLDIQMPGINGIELVKSLPSPPLVIFTTAYADYAIDGYDLDIVDYLLKPITLSRFLKAVNRAQDYLMLTMQAASTADKVSAVDYLFVKSNRQLQKVVFDDILFIEAMLNYVIIHTSTQKIITYSSIKSMQDSLPASLFMKVHKSYIVRTGKITSLQGYELSIGTHTLPVSRSHREELRKRISQGK